MPQQKHLSTDSCEAKYMQMLALCGRGLSHTSTVAAAESYKLRHTGTKVFVPC